LDVVLHDELESIIILLHQVVLNMAVFSEQSISVKDEIITFQVKTIVFHHMTLMVKVVLNNKSHVRE